MITGFPGLDLGWPKLFLEGILFDCEAPSEEKARPRRHHQGPIDAQVQQGCSRVLYLVDSDKLDATAKIVPTDSPV